MRILSIQALASFAVYAAAIFQASTTHRLGSAQTVFSGLALFTAPFLFLLAAAAFGLPRRVVFFFAALNFLLLGQVLWAVLSGERTFMYWPELLMYAVLCAFVLLCAAVDTGIRRAAQKLSDRGART